ncbi:ubiquitin-like domain-containing protein [Streptomyces sp. NPDC050428]|uniref:ubiquitin-like domain-containing protein n=1 Tax=Streptomyces sp. NPDC050428 TaxID=3155757 RepID=UPI0034172FA0
MDAAVWPSTEPEPTVPWFAPTEVLVPHQAPPPQPQPPLPAPDPGGADVRADAGADRTPRRRLVPQALVVAVLAGGTSAFVASDKAVKLSVDGTPRTFHTFADDVDELLADEGVKIGEHDIVAPGRGAELTNGDTVVVRHGRPVMLTLDGRRRQIWTTADTVEGALRQLGVRAEGALLSVSRSSAIPRSGLALEVLTERTVTFMADGRERTIRTNAATVREALADAGLTLRGEDTTSVRPDSFPRDGQTVTVMRITVGEMERDEAIPYDTERTWDASLFTGTEVITRQGEQGTRRLTYAVRAVNGVKERPRKIAERIVRAPVTQRVRVGTKQRPAPVAGTGGRAPVAGADGLNWAGLAACESGGRPDAVDPSGTYGGLYQFDTGTWHALGGSGRPQDASAEEQTYRAKKLYAQRGASPWPHCGRRLHG